MGSAGALSGTMTGLKPPNRKGPVQHHGSNSGGKCSGPNNPGSSRLGTGDGDNTPHLVSTEYRVNLVTNIHEGVLLALTQC